MKGEKEFIEHIQTIDYSNLEMIMDAVTQYAELRPNRKMFPDYNITFTRAAELCKEELKRRDG